MYVRGAVYSGSSSGTAPARWRRILSDGEPACRRGSVPGSPCGGRGGGHPSVRSTWGDRPDRPSHVRPCSGWGLPSHRGRPRRWCALTAPFHPCLCPVARAIGGLLSVALNRQVTPSWLAPAPCPSEPRPSSTWSSHAAATRPAHRRFHSTGTHEEPAPKGRLLMPWGGWSLVRRRAPRRRCPRAGCCPGRSHVRPGRHPGAMPPWPPPGARRRGGPRCHRSS